MQPPSGGSKRPYIARSELGELFYYIFCRLNIYQIHALGHCARVGQGGEHHVLLAAHGGGETEQAHGVDVQGRVDGSLGLP